MAKTSERDRVVRWICEIEQILEEDTTVEQAEYNLRGALEEYDFNLVMIKNAENS